MELPFAFSALKDFCHPYRAWIHLVG